MKQIIQNLKTGQMELAEVPCPSAGPGQILIQTRRSLISAGTERMLVEFSRANLIQKAKQQPEKVRQVLDKMKTDGLLPTLEAVFRKLDEPLPLGYCNAGVVLEVGHGIHDIDPGDRVISNGNHAEIVSVPRNLCAKVPEGVTDEQAAFTVLGSIALQGVRLAQPELGEKFVVFGLGLVGLLTVQLLLGSGCQVLAVDYNRRRLELAEKSGARCVDLAAGADPIAAAQAWSAQKGVDGAIITASAKSDEIVHQAAESLRKRGRIILVGVVGLNLRRSDFYEKELTFQVSCSYGPGRYDEKYEQQGQDYPYGLVRWTEQRNFEAILNLLQQGRLQVDELITNRVPFTKALEAYEKIRHDSRVLGVVLEYANEVDRTQIVTLGESRIAPAPAAQIGIIGAGNFARGILLPALAKTPAQIKYIADLQQITARHAGLKYGARQVLTDYKVILADPEVNALFIVVGHHLHARFVCEALAAGKHVFVEKPLALNNTQLNEVLEQAANTPDKMVIVGFNRRFSPHTIKIRELLKGRSEPLCMTMTVNAGAIPADHWIQDPHRGGGRIIGEGCHFIDLLSFIADSPVESVAAMMIGGDSPVRNDKMAIALYFADGSVGTVNYFANGSKAYPKEILEVFSQGRVIRLENFRETRAYGFRGFRKFRTLRQDKGHNTEIALFIERIQTGGSALIPLSQLENITRASMAVERAAREKQVIHL